jgi:hypothetical protein
MCVESQRPKPIKGPGQNAEIGKHIDHDIISTSEVMGGGSCSRKKNQLIMIMIGKGIKREREKNLLHAYERLKINPE